MMPSSRFLADELARFVREGKSANRPAWRVLEIGPGTGAVTDSIIAALGPEDTLDLVELNDEFVAHLRHRLATEPAWQAVSSRVRILHQPVELLEGDVPYDRIVSGLPFNNFAVADVERILNAWDRLVAPNARLSYFEYFAIRKVRSLVGNRADRERLRGIGRVTGNLLARRETVRKVVWLNSLPACVHHLSYGTPG